METKRIFIRSTFMWRRSASGVHPIPRAPADENIDGPDPGPVEPGGLGPECLPEPRHRLGLESGGPHRLRIAESAVHVALEALPDPPFVGEHEAALGPLEQRLVEAPQPHT